MSAADERAKALKAATIDFDKALILAEKVSDAWYRCQSLAVVARFARCSPSEDATIETLEK